MSRLASSGALGSNQGSIPFTRSIFQFDDSGAKAFCQS